MRTVFLTHFCAVPFFLCILIAELASCATTKMGTPIYHVYITNTRRVAVLPPSALDSTVDQLYQLKLSYKDDDFSILAYVSADKTAINIVMLSDFGTEVGAISYTADGISATALPDSLPAKYIIMDFQNAFYALDALHETYATARLNFTEVPIDHSDAASGATTVRTIRDGNKIIETITYAGNVITIANHLRGYTYTLTGASE